MIGRRALVRGLVLTVLAPVAAGAQAPARAARVGVLLFSDPGSDPNMRAFREGLREHGYVEGQNLSLDYRYAEGRPERLRDLALELVRGRPEVIFALGGDVAPSALEATRTIPIVMVASGDPVRGRLVASLAAPGGNVTGMTLQSSDLAAKRLQYLKEAAPKVSRIVVLWNPGHADDEFLVTQTAGRSIATTVLSVEARDAAQIESGLQGVTASAADALIVVPSRTMVGSRDRIVEFATRQRLPLAGGWGLWAERGALLSYGPDPDAAVRRAAGYVARVLKGARPAELPVEQPTTFELVVNLKTAKALGLTIPESLLQRADRVVQ